MKVEKDWSLGNIFKHHKTHRERGKERGRERGRLGREEEGGRRVEGISSQEELYPEAVDISSLGGFSHPPCPQGVLPCS